MRLFKGGYMVMRYLQLSSCYSLHFTLFNLSSHTLDCTSGGTNHILKEGNSPVGFVPLQGGLLLFTQNFIDKLILTKYDLVASLIHIYRQVWLKWSKRVLTLAALKVINWWCLIKEWVRCRWCGDLTKPTDGTWPSLQLYRFLEAVYLLLFIVQSLVILSGLALNRWCQIPPCSRDKVKVHRPEPSAYTSFLRGDVRDFQPRDWDTY